MAAASILRERLAADPGGLHFAEAVFAQLIGPAGALGAAPPATRDALALHLADLLLQSAAGATDGLAHRLLAEPALAAAFFQNLDLLYTHSSAHADAVSALLMRTLELAAHAESGGS
jgi:hypothetical protein